MAQTALCSATVDPLILLLWLRAQGETWGLCSWQVEATQLLTLLVHCSKQTRGAVWRGRKQIRNGGEVSRRNLREHIGSTRHYNAIPAPASPQSHSHTTGWLQESVQQNKKEVLTTVLHAFNPSGFWGCTRLVSQQSCHQTWPLLMDQGKEHKKFHS